MTISYLVSTAGHAQYQNEQHPHQVSTILQLVQEGAAELGDEKVVGFTSLASGTLNWICERYSYPQLLSQAESVKLSLLDRGVPVGESNASICLLCPTGLEFLVSWIALMIMGYGVVLVAPQCSPSAVQHLFQSTNSKHLVFHPKYESLAREALGLTSAATVELPKDTTPKTTQSSDGAELRPEAVSHIFHTSGTSGVPKPIPQTHLQSVAVLPRRALPSYIESSSSSKSPAAEPAAFTTTPLFHGGVSDLLRAWMARSMIYFYPTSDVPITASNVVAAVDVCNAPPLTLPGQSLTETQRRERAERFRVTAFLSVPYILSILEEDTLGPGMEMLRKMELVSTGGAPLDTATGDRMVASNVRLVSRLGSSECGFLMSSHRDYGTEKDWELLRNDSAYADALRFEPVDSVGPPRFEMVVTDRWSSKTKSNRPDGSYATGDLYEKHPEKAHVWRYVGRGDDVLVLSNGEKALPGAIEIILRSSPDVADALVVGSDRAQLGVLLFPRDVASGSGLVNSLSDLLKQANDASPSYAQMSPDLCFVVSDPERIAALPKSSKGTIQRGVAYDVFKMEIDQLYKGNGELSTKTKRSLSELQAWLRAAVLEITASQSSAQVLTADTDLFNWGVDSVKATRLRSAMQKSLYIGEKSLPNNVVFEQPSIARLAQYISARQDGVEHAAETAESTWRLMESLAAEFGSFDGVETVSAKPTDVRGGDLILTGATGSLGVFLLRDLCQASSQYNRIVCLVRASDDASALQRVLGALSSKNLSVDRSKLVAFAADVTQENLGLSEQVHNELVTSSVLLIHAAWPVHFASSLISFKDQIMGVRKLIDFTRSTRSCRLFYCSSIASVLGTCDDQLVAETASEDPRDAVPIGYSQSKWVSERILSLVSQQLGMQHRFHILRIGQLCGDTVTGHWNEKEGWPLLIRTVETAGALPLLTEKPSWMPVDLCAKIIIEIVQLAGASPFISHVTHPTPFDWQTALSGIEASGIKYEKLLPQAWVACVDQRLPEDDPSRQMLNMWRAAYGDRQNPSPGHNISTDNAMESSANMRRIQPISASDVEKMIEAWRRSGFLASAARFT